MEDPVSQNDLETRAAAVTALLALPWWDFKHDTPTYSGFGYRLLLNEVKAGRLRAARVGGRRELLTCRAWVDEWITARTVVVPVKVKR